MIHFTSDTHFNHKTLIERGFRSMFQNVDDMNEEMIRRWNVVVDHKDTVYHLGDVSFGNRIFTESVLTHLNGNIVLIRGNHDSNLRSSTLAMFNSVHDYYEIKDGQYGDHPLIVLCHYPLQSWNKMHYGSWHPHGHSHGSMPVLGKRLDVGVDCHAFAPISLPEVAAILNAREIQSLDHHQPRKE